MNGETGFVSIFNGRDLTGWAVKPRIYCPLWPGGPTVEEAFPDLAKGVDFYGAADHPAIWTVEAGAIVGRQSSSDSGYGGRYGGYLVTEATYGDFDLILEANPDWPVDTGIVVRKHLDGMSGLQVLVDHRKSGNIGGFFGAGVGTWHAVGWVIDAEVGEDGKVLRLFEEDPATTHESKEGKDKLLTYSSTAEEFLSAWRPSEWNEIRVRVVGEKPTVTTWVNDVKMAEINLETLDSPHYDADVAATHLGRRGHLAFEVHDSPPHGGERIWGPGLACRYRNIRIRELTGQR